MLNCRPEPNHPGKRNCLSKAVLRELAGAVKDAQSEPGIRVVVLAGQPEFFSAGADVSDMAARGVEAYSHLIGFDIGKRSRISVSL